MALTSRQACNMVPSDDQNHLWLQTTMDHEDQGLMMDSSSSPSGADNNNNMLVSSGPPPIFMSDRRLRPPQDQALKCPRCDSSHTKFCYYNNYSLSQPRYFCKTCRRYWTRGGTLRNIPVGGGCRKNPKKSSSKKSWSSNIEQQQSQAPASMINSQPMMMQNHIADLQLSYHNENLYQFSNMMAASNGHGSGGGYMESKLFNRTSLLSDNSSNNGLIRPIDLLVDHKVVDSLLMNTNRSNNDKNGFSGSGQFAENYLSNNYGVLSLNSHDDNVQSNFGYDAVHHDDHGVNNYIDSTSAAHQLDYTQLDHHHHQNVSSVSRDFKPNTTKLLALEWQPARYSDARASKEVGYTAGSWSGMISAGHNNYHHQLPSTD